LITKIDTAEVYAPLRRESLQVGVAVAVLVLTLAGITGAWWRRERLVLEMRYRQSDLERKLVTERLHDLARNANDIIVLIGPDGRLLDCNDRALAAYGSRA
jgi:PAS domain-containing protein